LVSQAVAASSAEWSWDRPPFKAVGLVLFHVGLVHVVFSARDWMIPSFAGDNPSTLSKAGLTA